MVLCIDNNDQGRTAHHEFRDEMLSMIGERHVLQQHLPTISHVEQNLAGTRSGTALSCCHTTVAAARLDGICRRLQSHLSTTAEPPIEFKSYGDVLSIRARGRDPASDQPNR